MQSLNADLRFLETLFTLKVVTNTTCKKSRDLYKERDIFMHIAHLNSVRISMRNDACKGPPFLHDNYFRKILYLTKYSSETIITLFNCMVVFHSIFSIWHGQPLSYLHGKNLSPVQIMNSDGMNSKNIVKNVGITNDSVDMHNICTIIMRWTMSLASILGMNCVSCT